MQRLPTVTQSDTSTLKMWDILTLRCELTLKRSS